MSSTRGPGGEQPPRLVPVPDPEPLLVPVPDSGEPPLPEPDPEPDPRVLADLDELDVDAPRVAIIVADRADLAIMDAAESELDGRDVRSEVRVMSADEEPRAIADYVENAKLRGIRVVIAGAGPAARLPTMVTVHTELPVIGVPLSSQGAQAGRLDGLLSESPSPDGEPVGWVGLDDARDAAVLAARILSA